MDDNRGEKTVEEKRTLKKRHPIGYVLGSIALFSAACAVVPAAMSAATGLLYKAAVRTTNDAEDDDWGPVIERKEKKKDKETAKWD